MNARFTSLQLILSLFCSVISGIFVFATISSARPTAAPIGDNLGAPIFVNTDSATKQGPLAINGNLTTNATTTTTASTPTLCINGDCRSGWPNLTPPNPNINNVVDAGYSTTSYPYFYGGGSGFYMESQSLGYGFRSSWPSHSLSFSGEYGQIDTAGGGGYPKDIFCPYSNSYISSTQANIWARLQWFRCRTMTIN